MKRSIPAFFIPAIAYCLILLPFTLFAQKLPDIQDKSIFAPPSLKVDGKAAEWGAFQAYNKMSLVYYTISNNQENLYLTVKSPNKGMTAKILYGGLTFMINSSANKKDRPSAGITFPDPQIGGLMSLISMALGPVDRVKRKGELTAKQADSIGFILNRQQIDKLKNVIVSGIPEVNDTLSVYNETGILARALFDYKEVYTYELAVPLKYIRSLINSDDAFFYTLRFNGPTSTRMLPINLSRLTIGGLDLLFLSNPSDFSGKYVLAKK